MRKTSLEMVHRLACADRRVVYIGSDLGPGTLGAMQQEFPDRYFMEGIAEQQLIGMAAGLAMDGFIPYVNTIATFLTRRCYEQIAVDLCMHNLPVRLIANGGGLVYAPLGPTHQATDDLALLRALPNMTVLAPCDADEMRRLLPQTLELPGPVYIRLGKGGDRVVSRDALRCRIGAAIPLREGRDLLLVTTGVMTQRGLAAAERLAARGIGASLYHCHTVKPLDTEIAAVGDRHPLVVTLEEHGLIGGLGSAVAELFADRRVATPLLRLALPDRFQSGYGSQDELLDAAGLAPDAIAARIEGQLGGRAANPGLHVV